jgi:hypothetical protein
MRIAILAMGIGAMPAGDGRRLAGNEFPRALVDDGDWPSPSRAPTRPFRRRGTCPGAFPGLERAQPVVKATEVMLSKK